VERAIFGVVLILIRPLSSLNSHFDVMELFSPRDLFLVSVVLSSSKVLKLRKKNLCVSRLTFSFNYIFNNLPLKMVCRKTKSEFLLGKKIFV